MRTSCAFSWRSTDHGLIRNTHLQFCTPVGAPPLFAALSHAREPPSTPSRSCRRRLLRQQRFHLQKAGAGGRALPGVDLGRVTLACIPPSCSKRISPSSVHCLNPLSLSFSPSPHLNPRFFLPSRDCRRSSAEPCRMGDGPLFQSHARIGQSVGGDGAPVNFVPSCASSCRQAH